MASFVRPTARYAATALAAGAVFFFFHRYRMSLVVTVAAFVVGIAGLIVPCFFSLLDRWVAALTRAVGGLLTWALLLPFFWLVFVPARLMLLLKGKDPMTRRCPSPEATYWIPRAARKPDHFTRQF